MEMAAGECNARARAVDVDACLVLLEDWLVQVAKSPASMLCRGVRSRISHRIASVELL